jgi:hypothetical protein
MYENLPKLSSPPFYSLPRSSHFYFLLPTCNGVLFVVAPNHQLHFQCLEVATYVLNACVHVGFQVLTTLTLVHCRQELHKFMIYHHDEHASKFFFTFVSPTIVREHKFKYFLRFCLFSMFYNSSNFQKSCEYFTSFKVYKHC